MTNPIHYLWRMLVFLVVVAGVAFLLHKTLLMAFAANPVLDAVILLVLFLGILWNFRQVLTLRREVHWVEAFQTNRSTLTTLPAPRLLAPMASMLTTRVKKAPDGGERFTLSAPAMHGMLDSIQSRLDESRELSRYMTGLMIFLGLLGTFWGLLLTVGSVGDVIAGMSVGSGDVSAMFDQLKNGLAQPLRGMGTAFSVSMLGLSGALVLGFLDLTAGQAQNRFFNELEEWLAGLTRLSSGALSDGDSSIPVYVQALLEQTAENMESLQRTLARGEASRREGSHAVLALSDKLGTMTESMRANQQLMLRIAESQHALTPLFQNLAQQGSSDDAIRQHLRNIEATLIRLLNSAEQGRSETTSEIRNEIRLLTRTIEHLSQQEPPR